MLEAFTERACLTLDLAREEATMLGQQRVGSEHLLLGLIREEQGLSARVLEGLGLTIDDARAVVTARGRQTAVGDESVAAEVEASLQQAPEVAAALGEKYVGTDHLLLTLMGAANGAAAQVVVQLGAQPDEIAKVIRRYVPRGEPGRV